MRPPTSASEDHAHGAEKNGLSRYSDFFNRIGQNPTSLQGRGTSALPPTSDIDRDTALRLPRGSNREFSRTRVIKVRMREPSCQQHLQKDREGCRTVTARTWEWHEADAFGRPSGIQNHCARVATRPPVCAAPQHRDPGSRSSTTSRVRLLLVVGFGLALA
jgi:hypothetical protein